jgi:predicted RNA-binding Zn ribbon-like protein
LEWLADAGLLERALVSTFKRRVRAVDLDAVATEARELRTWASAWLSRWCVTPEAGYESELQKLNGWLRRGSLFRQVVRAEDGSLAAVERSRGESAGELIAVIAAQIADLVSHEDPTLVKRCAGTSCTLWFLDRTKAHRRRFCSPTACGNREKVAAFRERQRQSS